jgi:surface carbohydrate biosynthesis protein
MRRLSERMFEILRDLGHDIVGWDEEALVRYPDPAIYYERRLSPLTLAKVAALFAWGPENAELFRAYPGYSGAPIHVTGNPRTDMMRPELRGYFRDDVEQIRKRFDRFVLVNTNFGWPNHYLPRLRLDHPDGRPRNAFEAGLAPHRQALFEAFLEMVPALARALPERTILVRPHPIERHAPWQRVAEQAPNVRVVNEGNVVPWLMACDALVHVGCTTGVEAAVLGTPAIAYQPVRSAEHDERLPNELSHRAFDLPQLIETVRSVATGALGAPAGEPRRLLIERHIAALDGPLASERMVDVLEGMGYAERRPPRPRLSDLARGWRRNQVRTARKRINSLRPGHRNSRSYHDHRFPTLTTADIEERVARLRRELRRFDGVRVSRLAPHLFRVDAA